MCVCPPTVPGMTNDPFLISLFSGTTDPDVAAAVLRLTGPNVPQGTRGRVAISPGQFDELFEVSAHVDYVAALASVAPAERVDRLLADSRIRVRVGLLANNELPAATIAKIFTDCVTGEVMSSTLWDAVLRAPQLVAYAFVCNAVPDTHLESAAVHAVAGLTRLTYRAANRDVDDLFFDRLEAALDAHGWYPVLSRLAPAADAVRLAGPAMLAFRRGKLSVDEVVALAVAAGDRTTAFVDSCFEQNLHGAVCAELLLRLGALLDRAQRPGRSAQTRADAALVDALLTSPDVDLAAYVLRALTVPDERFVAAMRFAAAQLSPDHFRQLWGANHVGRPVGMLVETISILHGDGVLERHAAALLKPVKQAQLSSPVIWDDELLALFVGVCAPAEIIAWLEGKSYVPPVTPAQLGEFARRVPAVAAAVVSALSPPPVPMVLHLWLALADAAGPDVWMRLSPSQIPADFIVTSEFAAGVAAKLGSGRLWPQFLRMYREWETPVADLVAAVVGIDALAE